MGFTQEQLDQIEAAFATGASETQIGDRKIKLTEALWDRIKIMRRELAPETATPGPVVVTQLGWGRR